MGMPAALKSRVENIVSPVPTHLRSRHMRIDHDRHEQLRESLKVHFFSGWRDPAALTRERFEFEERALLDARLNRYRKTYVPWIDSVRTLKGATVLEVGCGTGASTVALAEQGAEVTAIDIDEGSLQVARDRLRLYGIEVDVRNLNACDLSSLPFTFDLVIYNACLEHMLIPERLQSLRQGAGKLAAGGMIVIVETPNRLWWDDTHTSKLPLFHSLPDELAYQYASFSPRKNFREIYGDAPGARPMEHFLRRGRGMSFHEIDLAVGAVDVVSTLGEWEGLRGRLRAAKKAGNVRSALRRARVDAACRKLLRLAFPDRHKGWHQEYLHLVLAPRGNARGRA